MFKIVVSNIRLLIRTLSHASAQFKRQYAFELTNATICSKTGQHMVEAKVIGKGQSISCLAQEILADNDFIVCFSPADIRTITCFAMTDKYETILYQEKIKKSYDIIRSKDMSGKKSITIKNKLTGDLIVKSISDFADGDLIDNLESKDAYHLGYLAGQEQIFRNFAHIKLLSSKSSETNLQTEN